MLVLTLSTTVVANSSHQLTIVLDWYLNPNHAPLFVAEREGFFREQNLQVTLRSPGDARDNEKMVALGQADIAIVYQPFLAIGGNHNLELTQFATLIQEPLSCLVVLQESGIDSLAKLQGKRIGHSGSSADQWMLATMLKQINLKITDVILVNVKFNLLTALLSGTIDGFIGGMRNFEPLALELVGKKAVTFLPEKYGFPKYEELILVTHRSRSNSNDIKNFTLALKKATAYLKKYPTNCWQKFAAANPELNNELNRRSWFETIKYFSDNI